MSLQVCENVVCISNSLDLDETPSYKLIAYGTIGTSNGLMVKMLKSVLGRVDSVSLFIFPVNCINQADTALFSLHLHFLLLGDYITRVYS